MRVLMLALTLVVPQQVPVDFSGVYKADSALSQALTESKGLKWIVAGAGAGGVAPTPQQMNDVTPLTIMTQTATQLIIEDRGKDLHRKSVFNLDGSESANTMGIATTRSRAQWKGRSLVITSMTHMELPDGRVLERPRVSTRTLMPDGNIHVETRATLPEQGNKENITWTVLVRQKAAK